MNYSIKKVVCKFCPVEIVITHIFILIVLSHKKYYFTTKHCEGQNISFNIPECDLNEVIVHELLLLKL